MGSIPKRTCGRLNNAWRVVSESAFVRFVIEKAQIEKAGRKFIAAFVKNRNGDRCWYAPVSFAVLVGLDSGLLMAGLKHQRRIVFEHLDNGAFDALIAHALPNQAAQLRDINIDLWQIHAGGAGG